MFRVVIFVILIPSLSFFSCLKIDQEDVDQELIKSYYSLIYEAETEQSIATAFYTFNNTLIRLNDPAEVLFSGSEMAENDALGFYNYTYTDETLIPSGLFEYTNEDGIKYTNNISLTDSINVPNEIEISFAESNITWTGPAVRENQTITFFIRNDLASFSKSTDVVGSTSILLERGELSLVFTGENEVFFTRNERFPLEEGTSEGGEIAAEYRSKVKPVIVQ